jgi:hypothetical protein
MKKNGPTKLTSRAWLLLRRQEEKTNTGDLDISSLSSTGETYPSFSARSLPRSFWFDRSRLCSHLGIAGKYHVSYFNSLFHSAALLKLLWNANLKANAEWLWRFISHTTNYVHNDANSVHPRAKCLHPIRWYDPEGV